MPISRSRGWWASEITWKLAGQVAIQLIRLLTVAVLARFLTPADYGAAAIAIALAAFAPTVADMGIGSALVQAKTASRTGPLDGFLGVDRLRASGCS